MILHGYIILMMCDLLLCREIFIKILYSFITHINHYNINPHNCRMLKLSSFREMNIHMYRCSIRLSFSLIFIILISWIQSLKIPTYWKFYYKLYYLAWYQDELNSFDALLIKLFWVICQLLLFKMPFWLDKIP